MNTPTPQRCIMHSFVNWTFLFALWAAANLATANSAAGQSIISNGDFETAPVGIRGAIPGWIVGGPGRIAANAEGATSGTHSAAFNEGGDSQGNTLSQTFPTVPGQLYALDFDAAVFGAPSAPLQLRVQVTASFFGLPVVVDATVTPPSSNTYTPGQVRFQHYHFTFMSSLLTEVKFTDVGLGNAAADIVVDSVKVVAVSPSLLVNGDFETGPFDTRGVVTGWHVDANRIIEVKNEAATTGTYSAAFNAGGDSQNNFLGQGFAAVPGQTYALEFDAGIFGIATAPLQLHVEVIGNWTLVSDDVSPPYAATYDRALVRFQHYRYTFVADTSPMSITFRDKGLGNAGADTVLDSVTVTPIAATPTPTPNPSLLINGDFEAAPFGSRSVITGWEVRGADMIAENAEGSTTGTHCAAFDEGGNSQGNRLSQTFATTAGQLYRLEFDTGIFGIKTGNLQLRTTLTGSSSLLDQLATPLYAATYDARLVKFQHYSYIFTANSDYTTLEFSDVGLGNASADVVLDSVSVVGPNPPVQLLPNGDFEGGTAGWGVGGTAGIVADAYPHTGNLHGYLKTNSSQAIFISDGILIPDAATTLTLSFWLNITSQKQPGTSSDQLRVSVNVVGTGGARGNVILATFSEADQGPNQPGNPNYAKYTFDLSSIWGTQTTLRGLEIVFGIEAAANPSLPTVFRIDDVRLEATIP